MSQRGIITWIVCVCLFTVYWKCIVWISPTFLLIFSLSLLFYFYSWLSPSCLSIFACIHSCLLSWILKAWRMYRAMFINSSRYWILASSSFPPPLPLFPLFPPLICILNCQFDAFSVLCSIKIVQWFPLQLQYKEYSVVNIFLSFSLKLSLNLFFLSLSPMKESWFSNSSLQTLLFIQSVFLLISQLVGVSGFRLSVPKTCLTLISFSHFLLDFFSLFFFFFFWLIFISSLFFFISLSLSLPFFFFFSLSFAFKLANGNYIVTHCVCVKNCDQFPFANCI